MKALRIVVIGSGFGGLAAVIELKRRGYDDIVVIEKAQEVGGVWRENTYPGAACDVPSPFYCFSFEPNPRWPHRYSHQPAILDYLRGVADTYDVRRHIRFGTEVTRAAYDDASGTWTIETDTGEPIVADVLVPAVGQLSRPAFPDFPGRDDFSGDSFHSALWDHDVDLTGKRVAVIGTGASAIQFIPAIQPDVARLDVYQRSAPYLLPRPDREFSDLHHRVFTRVPITQLAERATWFAAVESLSVAWAYSRPLAKTLRAASKWHMRRGAAARPGLFDKVWPDYPIGCKRVLFSDNYLPALAESNVEVISDRVHEITPNGVLTADGVERPVDVIIWGTGFKATEFLAPMKIEGAGGQDLHEFWADGAHAYYGLSVPGFPNLLVMYGPNTNTGGGSIVYFLETQARYIGDFVDHVARSGKPLTVRPEVEKAYDDQIQGELSGSVWSQCTSWYRTASGRITTNWPLLSVQYRKRARFAASDYVTVPGAYGALSRSRPAG